MEVIIMGKKNILFVISIILAGLILITGCSGGGSGRRTGYTYKWSNGETKLAKTLSVSPQLNFIAYADEDDGGPTFLGPEIPPFTSVDDGNRVCGYMLIQTYYNGSEVQSVCTCDPSDGEITEYDLSGRGDYIVPWFIPKHQGVLHVTATYNNETLDIPVRVYHFGYTNLNRMDFDKDGINDIQDFTALYGCRIIDNEYLSLVSSAPEGEYSSNTPLSGFVFGKIYIIKTSSGRYCKFWPTGYAGENSYTGVDFLSDENGNFAY